jgi:ABC-2 type transport system permease protein
MRKIWLLFWHTYWDNISRPGYLIFTFGLPFFIVAVPTAIVFLVALAVGLVRPETDSRPIGLVDRSGVFAETAVFPDGPVALVSFNSLELAAAALDGGEIQAYYYLDDRYWQTGEVVMTYHQPPSREVRDFFSGRLRRQIYTQVPEEVLGRYLAGVRIVHQNMAGEDAFTEDNTVEWAVVFMLIYLVRSAGVFTSGYMFDSIVSEGRNRTLEILLTTVSRLQFIAGKVSALLAVGLTQLGVWGGGLAVMLLLGAAVFEVDLVGTVLAWEHTRLVVSMLLGAYVLDQLLAASAGMLRVGGGAGQQLFNVMSWVTGLALIYVLAIVPRSPDAPLAVALSLFPLSSPMVMLVRVVAAEVPLWQQVLGEGLLWGTCFLGIFGLRGLLNINLVANAPRFKSWRWLRQKVGRRG